MDPRAVRTFALAVVILITASALAELSHPQVADGRTAPPFASRDAVPSIDGALDRSGHGDTIPSASEPAIEPGERVVVRSNGDCLNLRSAPGLSADRLACIPDGSEMTVVGSPQHADGYRWLPVDTGYGAGWAADAYLERVAGGSGLAGGDEPITDGEANLLPAPPPGGLTFGVAGTSDPQALSAAQPFPVTSIAMLDLATQQFLIYIEGAPAWVNSLTSATLRPDAVVVVRRTDATDATNITDTTGPAAPSTPVEAVTIADAKPTQLPVPPLDGITQGVSGTADPAALVSAQGFEVETVWTFDVARQRFLVYIPGAPAAASDLTSANLRPDSIVILKRTASDSEFANSEPANSEPANSEPSNSEPADSEPADSEPAETPAAEARPAGEGVLAVISYYYCEAGEIAASIGDGGGFCSLMASGETVYAGAASCAPGQMGRRFTIEGDPTGRTYTCADTGSGVRGEHRDIWFATSDEGYLWFQIVGPSAYVYPVE